MPARLARLTYVLPINSDTLAKRTTHAAYVLILVWARDAAGGLETAGGLDGTGKSSHLALIGCEVAIEAGAPMAAA